MIVAVYDKDPGFTAEDQQPGAQRALIAGWLVDYTGTPPTEAEVSDRMKPPIWRQIKAERDRRKSGGVLVSGKWFHTDPDSRIQQLGLVMMGASVPSVPWKTMDGSFTPMSQSLAMAIFQAVAALDMALFAKAEEHRTAMLAAQSPQEYNWRTGWPAGFGE
jgi:hypothetical protein